MPSVSLTPEHYKEAMLRAILDGEPVDAYVNRLLDAVFVTDQRPEVTWFPVFSTEGHGRKTHFGVSVEGNPKPALCGIQARRPDLLWDTAPERPLVDAGKYLAVDADSVACDACKRRLLALAEAAAMPPFRT